MELKPTTLTLKAPGLQLNAGPDEAKLAKRAGQDFEALLVTRLLKSARAAKLGDDLLGSNDQVRDMIDEQRGRTIAQAAPLGLASLIAKGAGK
jgi:Rod binding domain-containing protein